MAFARDWPTARRRGRGPGVGRRRRAAGAGWAGEEAEPDDLFYIAVYLHLGYDFPYSSLGVVTGLLGRWKL